MYSFISNQRLKLFGDTIHVIEDDAFVGLKQLVSLDLSFCGLNKVPPLGPIKSNLERLLLSSNCLIDIPGDYFCGFTHLMSIRLEYHKFAISNITPLQATLAVLDLSENQIPSFEPFLTSTTFSALRILGVSKNTIRVLSRDMISCWPKLKSLHLRNNLLKNLEDLSGVIRVSSPKLTVL